MSKKWLVALTTACIFVAGTSAQAADGSIGVYLDEAGTVCAAPFTGPLTTGSVYFNLGGATSGGITGVEFRIDNGNSSAYEMIFNAVTEATVCLGDMFLTGVNIAFDQCQPGTGGRVKLGTVYITENVQAQDVTLTVRQHYYPSSETYPCALAVLCDDPVYTAVCIGAPSSDHWRSVLNPFGIAGDCTPVAVEAATWTQLKSLFN